MSRVYKTVEDGLYFVSFSVVGWYDVFIRMEYQDILTDTIQYSQKNKGLRLFAYCVMPSHVHMVAATEKKKLSDVLRDLKSFSAKQLMQAIVENPYESRKRWLTNQFKWHGKNLKKKDFQFWQHHNHPFELYSNKLIEQKINYIHQNPVKAGFVDEDWKWRLSSANPDSPIRVDDI